MSSHQLAPKPGSELKLRVISALAMVAIALSTLWWGGWPFGTLWTLIGMIAALEWLKIVWPSSTLVVRFAAGTGVASAGLAAFLGHEVAAVMIMVTCMGVVASVSPSTVRLFAAAGVAYAGAIAIAPIIVRAEPALGPALIAFCFAVVWSTDVAAYFTGRAFGGPKLWPAVSPKKTWSGAIGGALAGISTGVGVAWLARRFGADWTLGLMATAVCAFFASVAGQLGDLLESSLKRHFNVKDSGSLIPGHGGVLDRLDAFVIVAALTALAVVIWR